jgi:murein DD-endopeptidase MepM/ murein hydrolase activator NlpD
MQECDVQDEKEGRLRRLAYRLFPERQLHFRTHGRVSFLRLSHRGQIGLVVLAALAGSWMTVASVSYVLHDKLIDAKTSQIANARLAYRSLLDEVAEYQRKFAGLNRDLEENHLMMLNLVEQNTSLQQSLKSVESHLLNTEEERQAVVSAREKLKADLRDIEKKMGGVANRNFALRGNLDLVEDDLQKALSERNEALFINARMRRQIGELDSRLNGLQRSQHEAVQRLTEEARDNIESIERVIGLTGIKVSKLLASVEGYNQGGPFITVKPDGKAGGRMKANLANLDSHLEQWAALRKIFRVLPLTVPLNTFQISSGYGKRRDPINRRWAAHYGIDMISALRASVYATAPGVVTYVGRKGHYGRLVEVSHGAGVKTRYGHLHKTLVKRGAKVAFRQKIGLLGNTGRSTGAHLHYEVIVDKRPMNPWKFIKAGRYVLQK